MAIVLMVSTSLVLDETMAAIFGPFSCDLMLWLVMSLNLLIVMGGFGTAVYRLLNVKFPIKTR